MKFTISKFTISAVALSTLSVVQPSPPSILTTLFILQIHETITPSITSPWLDVPLKIMNQKKKKTVLETGCFSHDLSWFSWQQRL